MSGALLQLAALGAQDKYFVGNPEVTLFKSKYHRYTHFASETVIVSFDGGFIDFGSENEATATLEKSGDLISKMVLVIELDEVTNNVDWGYVDKLGHAMIDEIMITIGQTEIDIHYNDWINIYHDLYANKSHEPNYNKMIGNIPELKMFKKTHGKYELFIPLNFWLNKSTGSTFPICSLNKQNFQVKVKFRDAINCINYKGNTEPTNLPKIINSYFLVDYIFLGNEERKLFMTKDHEYMIEQVMEMTETITSDSSRVSLIFDKPCKYLVWYVILERYKNRNGFLSWAHDDNWEAAKTEFAKLLWLLTRSNLTKIGDDMYITLNQTVTNINNTLPRVDNGLEALENLESKIKGIFLFAQEDPNDATQYLINASVDNVIILENNLTFEDISVTIEELKDNYDTNNAIMNTQVAFMEKIQYNVIDIFNTGNYINRHDNPIVSSRLQLNGKDRFQERDGVFFNYLVPYYYFTNTPADGINCYSFALAPTEIQPSGTINLGQVNTKELIVTVGKQNIPDITYFNNFFKQGELRIFGYNYTLLKISPSKDLVGLSF